MIVVEVFLYLIGLYFLFKSLPEVFKIIFGNQPSVAATVIGKKLVNDSEGVASLIELEYSFEGKRKKYQFSVGNTGFLWSENEKVKIVLDRKGEVVRVLDTRVLVTLILFALIGIILLLNFLYIHKLLEYT